MSFWSSSLSKQWADDVARKTTSSSEHFSIDKEADVLPAPATASATRHPRLSSIYRKFRKGVRKRLIAPSPGPVIDGNDDDDDPKVLLDDDNELKTISGLPCAPDEVDEIVVDRSWTEEFQAPESHQENNNNNPEASDSGNDNNNNNIDCSGKPHDKNKGWLKGKLWPMLFNFFEPRFPNAEMENHYRRETWSDYKTLALWACVFLIANWVLGVIFIPMPLVLADKVYYYGIAPLLTVPLIFMCAYNMPVHHPTSYQLFLCVSTWSWSFYQVLFVYLCGYYDDDVVVFTCGTKDFLSTFYYTTALQTVALFGTNLKRLPAALGAVIFLVMSSCLIIPLRESYTRNIINVMVFQTFIIYMHYQREIAARKLYHLRSQFQIQSQRMERSQQNERRTADSKHRLTSYVFHEVRVPLNTALLAVQNMDASRTIAKDLELEFTALQGSLSMMSKVLNDVLDFNRMDSGRFESLSRPYAFHQVMRSMCIPLRLATNARNLEFVTDLDMNIDEVARRAAYEAMGESPATIDKHLKDSPSGESHWGMVVGDETRLRQIVTNLASNACKFTPAGGKLTMSTKLVLPESPTAYVSTPTTKSKCPSEPDRDEKELDDERRRTVSLDGRKRYSTTCPTNRIVVRIEITDTGPGIQPEDMAGAKLFSAFIQTEQGKLQGGKGTGLGLALVRHIVRLSGGRLGVRSKAGQGSTFWVELPLGVGLRAIIPPSDDSPMSPNMAPTLRDIFRVTRNRESMRSVNSIVEAVDAAAVLSSQRLPLSIRSTSALHSLMDQGGRVELILANFDSHSPAPTRTIGDPSTGSEYPRWETNSLTSLSQQTSRVSVSPVKVKVPPEGIPHNPRHSPQSLKFALDVRSLVEEVATTHPQPVPVPPPLEEASSSDTVVPLNKRPEGPVSKKPGFIPLPRPDPSEFSSEALTGGGSGSMMSSLAARSPGVMTDDPGAPEVLVVDDDPLTRTLMKRMLQRMGCTVTTAENGEVAWAILSGSESASATNPRTPSASSVMSGSGSGGPILERPSRFSVVFLDNQMPLMSGLVVVAKLREAGRQDFVVGVTGNALITDQNEYLEAGVDHVLTKPVRERDLKFMLTIAEERRLKESDQTTPFWGAS